MIYAAIGTALILYSLLLSPAFIEPLDLVMSTAYIAAATASGVPAILIVIWIASGYIALIIGVGLLGHSIIRHIPTIASGAKNPIVLVMLIIFLASVVCLWFAYVA